LLWRTNREKNGHDKCNRCSLRQRERA
jgi:hypothetical protein